MNGMNKFGICVVVAAGCATLAGPVRAQNIEASGTNIDRMFARDRTISVTQRAQPGYEPIGIEVGSFTLLPRLGVDSFYIDNIYATENNRTDDIGVTVSPWVQMSSNWRQHRLALTARADAVRYLGVTDENSTTFDVIADGRYDIGAGLSVSAFGGYRRQSERRSDPGTPNATRRPIVFDVLNVGGSLQYQRGRLRTSLLGSYSTLQFDDAQLLSGLPLPQDFRDRDVLRITGRAEYAVTPNFAVVGQITHNRNSYNRAAGGGFLDRSSKRIEALAGASFEFTSLLRGELGVGYIRQRFDSPIFRNISGFGGRAEIEYFPSALTTVSFRASRTIEESGLPAFPSYLNSTANLQVDHELLRNLVVSASTGYSQFRFKQPARKDNRFRLGVGANYKANRHIALTANFDHLGASSNQRIFGRKFSVNVFRIGVTLQF